MSAPASPMRVLLVAGARCRRMALTRLEAAGHQVRTADRSDHALAAIAERWPEVVVAERGRQDTCAVLAELRPPPSRRPRVAHLSAASFCVLPLGSEEQRRERLVAILDALTKPSHDR